MKISRRCSLLKNPQANNALRLSTDFAEFKPKNSFLRTKKIFLCKKSKINLLDMIFVT